MRGKGGFLDQDSYMRGKGGFLDQDSDMRGKGDSGSGFVHEG